MNKAENPPTSRLRYFLAAFLSGLVIIVIAAFSYNPRRTKHSNEASAVGTLRTINSSQVFFAERHESKAYGTLRELGEAGLIDAVLSTGVKYNYRFDIIVDKQRPDQAYTVTAVPLQPSPGKSIWFYSDQTGVIHSSRDGPAGPESNILTGRR